MLRTDYARAGNNFFIGGAKSSDRAQVPTLRGFNGRTTVATIPTTTQLLSIQWTDACGEELEKCPWGAQDKDTSLRSTQGT